MTTQSSAIENWIANSVSLPLKVRGGAGGATAATEVGMGDPRSRFIESVTTKWVRRQEVRRSQPKSIALPLPSCSNVLDALNVLV